MFCAYDDGGLVTEAAGAVAVGDGDDDGISDGAMLGAMVGMVGCLVW